MSLGMVSRLEPSVRLESEDEREERAAWDAFAAAAMTPANARVSMVASVVPQAASFADLMLAERRKRVRVDVQSRLAAVVLSAGIPIQDAMQMTLAQFIEAAKRNR